MPRNEVMERMAKWLYDTEHAELERNGFAVEQWDEMTEVEHQFYYNDALELLAIVEEHSEKLNFPTIDGADVFICADDELRDAFQLAREARKRREKGNNHSPNPGSKTGR